MRLTPKYQKVEQKDVIKTIIPVILPKECLKCKDKVVLERMYKIYARSFYIPTSGIFSICRYVCEECADNPKQAFAVFKRHIEKRQAAEGGNDNGKERKV